MTAPDSLTELISEDQQGRGSENGGNLSLRYHDGSSLEYVL